MNANATQRYEGVALHSARLRLRSRIVPVVAAITVLAAALRFTHIGSQSYWVDEAATVELLHRSFWGMLAAIPGGESTPPLYYILAWTWAKLVGTGEVALRSLSAVIGIAVVPTIYAAAKELVSARAGLIAAALAATSPMLVWYSQEARAYELLILLSAASLLFFARATLGSATRADYALWALFSALALATHYFAIFLVAPEGLLLLTRNDRRRQARVALAAVLVTVLALLPLAIYQARTNNAGWISHTAFGHRLDELVREFVSGRYHAGHMRVLAGILVAGILASVAVATRRERRGAAVALVLGVVAFLVPLILIPLGADFFFFRNLIVAWIPLSIALSAGLGASRAGAAGIAIGVAACAFGLYATVFVDSHPAIQKTDWRDAAHKLAKAEGVREIVVWPPEEALTVRLYTPEAQTDLSDRARVTEIGVLVRNAQLASIRTPKGFRRVEEEKVQNVAVLLFFSHEPRAIRRAELVRELRAPDNATLLREP